MSNNSDNEINDSNQNAMPIPQFDSVEFVIRILRYKYFVIAFTVLVTSFMVFYSLKLPNWYTSTVNVIPPKNSGSAFESALGNITSTLKNFGFTKLGPKSDGSYSLILLLDNRTIRDSIIEHYKIREYYGMQGDKPDDIRAAFKENVDITSEMEGNFTISITDTNPVRAAEIANDYVNVANFYSKDLYQSESRINKIYIQQRIHSTDSVIDVMTDSLQAFSKKYKVLIPEEQAKEVSKGLIDIKSEIIKQEIYLQLMINRYGNEDPMTNMQKDVISQMKAKLLEAENQPGYGGNFSMSNAAEVGVNFMRLYTDLETFTKVKSFLLPMLEEQKLNEVRDTKSFIVLDKALPADRKIKPKRSLYVLGAFSGSLVLSVLFVIIILGFKDFRKRYKSSVTTYYDKIKTK